VKGWAGTRTNLTDFPFCSAAGIAIGAPHFFLGRRHWRIHCIERHFVVIGPKGAAPSLHSTVSAQNVLRHANARYPPPSSDRVRDDCMRHLLPHAPHRILCSLLDRDLIQARRRPSPARGHDASSHVVEGVKQSSLIRNALPNTSRGHYCCGVADRPPARRSAATFGAGSAAASRNT
jgi:hypothetical protein